MGWRIYAAVWLVVAGLAQVSPGNQIRSAKLVRNFDILLRNMGNQVYCTHSDQRHQPRILVWAGGFTWPFGWFWLAWLRSPQTTKFVVPNWLVILTFCSEIWVTRSITLTLTSDISRGFWYGLADLYSRLAGLAEVRPGN